MIIKSPLTPLCKRGGKLFPLLEKGDRGGFGKQERDED
jgi:hypothetical protein